MFFNSFNKYFIHVFKSFGLNCHRCFNALFYHYNYFYYFTGIKKNKKNIYPFGRNIHDTNNYFRSSGMLSLISLIMVVLKITYLL